MYYNQVAQCCSKLQENVKIIQILKKWLYKPQSKKVKIKNKNKAIFSV